MSEQPGVAATITIVLPERLQLALAAAARETKTTEQELVQRAIAGVVQAHQGPGIPRFARRIGPIAIDAEGPSAA
jgi:hypothetical protein